MKVTFIEPAPSGFHVYSFIKQPRLGLPLLGTILRELGHEVNIFVENLGEIDWDTVVSSDLVGVSSITSTAMKAYRYAEKAREAGVTVVMGGPHVTFLADEALEFCDYVVRGEGEETLLELIELLKGNRSADGILGLSYHGDGRTVVHNPSRPLRRSLDDLPIPDIKMIAYHEKINPTPILTSRGCAFDCEFCSVIMMFVRKVRVDPADKIIATIRETEAEQIFFYDDNFILSKARTKRLLARMIREGIQVPFSAQVRIDSICKHGRVDHELLHLLREAGCFLVYLGLESVNPHTLAAFNKQQSVADIAGGLAALRAYGIKSHGMFVFGSDADTVETLRETTDFAISHDITSVQFMLLTPLPGTRQTAQLEAEGRVFTRNWTLYDGHHVVFWPKNMSPWDLQQEAMKAYQRFYGLGRVRKSHKYGFWGLLISRAWERVPENMAYMRELRSFTATQLPPASLRGEATVGHTAGNGGKPESHEEPTPVGQGFSGSGPNT